MSKQKLRKPWVIYLYIMYACAFKPWQQLLYHDVLSRFSFESNVQIGPHYECNYAQPDSFLIPFPRNKDMEERVWESCVSKVYPPGNTHISQQGGSSEYHRLRLCLARGWLGQFMEVNNLDDYLEPKWGPLS